LGKNEAELTEEEAIRLVSELENKLHDHPLPPGVLDELPIITF
jgi:hypothetical protein